MKTLKRQPAKKRKTLAGKIRIAPDDFRKSLLAEHGTCDYLSPEFEEVFYILNKQALLSRRILTSSGGTDSETKLAAKCVNAVKAHDADFFLRLAKEVRRQSVRFNEKYADPFHLHLLMLKTMNRWRVKSGLPKFTLRQVKPDPDRPETKSEVLIPSSFGKLSDRHWRKEAKVVGLSFLEGNSGRPKTRNK
ncbi:MAG: hypothetical protein RL514_282 [Verrucomicrobiota bacterium]